ncbi:MAG: hypothetical protein HIU91_01460 [Acidobacteria bacterium]|nr:hypothetical protein [Acidobacteriota bacterium]
MTSTALPNQQIDAYLAALRNHLAPLTLAEREDILREIGAHIRDSVDVLGTPIETALARLGPPEVLAAQYRDGLLVRAASRSLSPVLLLRATLRLATKGFVGVVVFFCGFTGYITGTSLILTGVLKPFMPTSVGLWTSKTTAVWQSNGPTFGIQTNHPPHEILGWWAIPIGLIGGALILFVTTFAIRTFLRLSQKWQIKLSAPIVFRG